MSKLPTTFIYIYIYIYIYIFNFEVTFKDEIMIKLFVINNISYAIFDPVIILFQLTLDKKLFINLFYQSLTIHSYYVGKSN